MRSVESVGLPICTLYQANAHLRQLIASSSVEIALQAKAFVYARRSLPVSCIGALRVT